MPLTPNLWQIAAGEDGRRYDDLFVKFDVMFLGPGYPGPYDAQAYELARASAQITKDERDRVARFHNEVHGGDFVLARRGKKVVAIGIVADDQYCHDDRFDDIHGWEVQHCRRVIWQEHLQNQLDSLQQVSPLFGHIKVPPTFTRAEFLRAQLQPLLNQCKVREPVMLPPAPPNPLSAEELPNKLFDHGIPFDAITRLCDAIRRVSRLVEWYETQKHSPYRPTEHEVIAHVILPIFVALGWSEQLLAIEWGKRDLAAFERVPTRKDNCVLVVEAKEMRDGLQNAWSQAVKYTSDLPNCERILLTNGIRNYIHFRKNGEWNSAPDYYFNLRRLREDHFCFPGINAIRGIVELTPARISRPRT